MRTAGSAWCAEKGWIFSFWPIGKKSQAKDGMLKVHLPKSEKAKPKSIEVKVG